MPQRTTLVSADLPTRGCYCCPRPAKKGQLISRAVHVHGPSRPIQLQRKAATRSHVLGDHAGVAKLQASSRDAEFVHSLSEWLDMPRSVPCPAGWWWRFYIWYIWVTYATLRHARTEGELAYGAVHV